MNEMKQPKGLSLLFFTELWERFGFYVLQTIFILYLAKGLHYSDVQATLLTAAFNTLLYLTPVLGGYLADTYLGFQRSIRWGGFLFIVGYLLTAIPGETAFFWGLSIVIVANGLFKPNVSSIVGELYHEDDPRRDGGFTIFYMGINIGALLPPLFIGALVAYWGWHAGFLSAAGGMLLGMLVFHFARTCLGEKGLYPRRHRENIEDDEGVLNKSPLTIKFKLIFLAGFLLSIVVFHVAMKFPEKIDLISIGAMIATMLVVLYFLGKEHGVHRNRMIAVLILIVISVGFNTLYNQTFTSLMLFADRNMTQSFLGFHIDAEFTQAFNPAFIILLSPFLSKLWVTLGDKNNPSVAAKFAFGVLMMSVGFLVLAGGAHFFNVDGMTASGWLAASYFFQTVGELLISPIGLSMITALCPKYLVGMMMGVWFVSQAGAFALSGELATYSAVPKTATLVQALGIYTHAFIVYGIFALVLAVIAFALVPFLRKLIAAHGDV